MRIVFAFDSFKGTLNAHQACRAAAESWRIVCPSTEAVEFPLADGGEGTQLVLLEQLEGEEVKVDVHDPLGRPLSASYGWCPGSRTGLVEMAAASGLTLLEDGERNPLLTSTFGSGELLRAVMAREPRRILLAVGGSATVDGGVGAANALGWRFLDDKGTEMQPGGGSLVRLADIVCPFMDYPEIEVLCDVTNPLTGPDGAARVFGPQKGATPEMVEQLEAGLERLAEVVQKSLGVDIARLPGGGAAGGLAAGAVAFMGAKLRRGIEVVLDATGFDDAVRTADWVVTGEGSFDAQSLQGKVVSGVLARTRQVNPGARVAVLAGRVDGSMEEASQVGVDYVDAITPQGMPFAEAKTRSEELMRAAVQRLATELVRG
jgi:glycerate 2-kinase